MEEKQRESFKPFIPAALRILRRTASRFAKTDVALSCRTGKTSAFSIAPRSVFFHRLRVSHITLDKYGAALWLRLDGQCSAFALVEEMKSAFSGEEDRMLDRCVQLLYTLDFTERWK